jgi:hypothetical protein
MQRLRRCIIPRRTAPRDLLFAVSRRTAPRDLLFAGSGRAALRSLLLVYRREAPPPRRRQPGDFR